MKKDYIKGSANVFADLGLPDAAEALAKAELVRRINRLIESRDLTQVQAARILGVDQPKVSALRRGELARFSLERLMRYIVLLGQDVEIVVRDRERPKRSARLRVA
ncbi:MAG TPA: helix-turn-helix transcriptional regulator [Bryobacterales bacterium]|nr:helix-turn-helix transcriptional regulator [Bryobacterales bacterium]